MSGGGSRSSLDVWSSWRGNSCDSDPGGGERRENSHIKTQLDSTAENVNHGISLSRAGAPREKQHRGFDLTFAQI